jgi:hypothetical protein
LFNFPLGIARSVGSLFLADSSNCRIRRLFLTNMSVVTVAGGICGSLDGFGVNAQISFPYGISLSPAGVIYFTEATNIRCINPCPPPLIFNTSTDKCDNCPGGFYNPFCYPLLCPAGSFCPLSSINATLCPKGSYSNIGAANCTLCPKGSYSNIGAANCTLCSAGTFAFKTGSTSCQQCPGGHYCPAGTSSWARLNCGRGNYCPDGSGAPTSCPYQVPPTGGWGDLQVQGPAFLVETAHCLNHCFWNFTSGDGMLSKC